MVLLTVLAKLTWMYCIIENPFHICIHIPLTAQRICESREMCLTNPTCRWTIMPNCGCRNERRGEYFLIDTYLHSFAIFLFLSHATEHMFLHINIWQNHIKLSYRANRLFLLFLPYINKHLVNNFPTIDWVGSAPINNLATFILLSAYPQQSLMSHSFKIKRGNVI